MVCNHGNIYFQMKFVQIIRLSDDNKIGANYRQSDIQQTNVDQILI